jgi:hypothetical protein
MACSSHRKMPSNGSDLIPFWTVKLMDSTQKNDFRMTFSSPKAGITGIFIVKQVNGEWRGTIINEFGLKVLDFTSNPKECKLVNVISFLDKWHIKKVIASDIRFIMEIDNPDYRLGVEANRYWDRDTLVVNYKREKELRRFPDGEIQYKNRKHELTYSFRKITI